MGSAEGYAGFGWIFGLWENVVLTLIASTEPILMAISNSSKALVFTSGIAWSFLVLIRLGTDGFFRGLMAGIIIFLMIAFGMRPATVQMPSGATVHVVAIQALAMNFSLSVHKIYRDTIEQVTAAHTVAGSIIPAQAASDHISKRGSQLFAGTDLERLIHDYNASCAPANTELAGEVGSGRIDNLHAVGLLGGGGLGIPEEEFSLLEQARTTINGFWDFAWNSRSENGGFLGSVMGGGAALEGMNRALDLHTIRKRRAAGMAELEANKSPFMGTEYVLPTQSHWEGLFSGKDGSASYIPTSELPGVGHPSPVVNPTSPPIKFRPSSCIDAYKIAHLGAQAAYRAMSASGDVKSGWHRISAESNAVGTVIAWQRVISNSLQKTTGLSEKGANTGGIVLAIAQFIKDAFAWFSLQTLLPGYVMLSAWIYWFAILIAPLVLVLMPIRGIGILVQWFGLLFLPVITMIMAHAVTVAISLVTAAVSIGQAAAASGWSDMGSEFDALRGNMGVMAALILALVTWIAGILSGVSAAGLAGSLGNAIATTSTVASAASTVAGKATMMSGRVARVAKTARDEVAKGAGGAASRAGGATARAAQNAAHIQAVRGQPPRRSPPNPSSGQSPLAHPRSPSDGSPSNPLIPPRK